MSERGEVWGDALDDAVELALTDHHLDELTEMIDRAQVDEHSSESPFSEGAVRVLRGS